MTLPWHTAAAIPALLWSLLLMRMADARPALLVQQLAVGAVAVAAVVASGRVLPRAAAGAGGRWSPMVLAACIWLPFFGASSNSPNRWVGVFGFRLYVASVVLPALLWLFLRPVSASAMWPAPALVALPCAAVGLFLQPDAPQLLALTIGCTPMLLMSRWSHTEKALGIIPLLVATALAWASPMRLEPVPYVEGVFALAWNHSRLLGVVTVILAALPCFALARVAWVGRSPAALGPCLYLATLFLLAPLQATPVPLLGFGAGPILGYFTVCACLQRTSTHAA